MIANWITQTGIGTVTDIFSVKGEKQTEVSVSGKILTVKGDFKSVDIYDATGRKLMVSTARTTEVRNLNSGNVYIAVVKGYKSVVPYKFSVRQRLNGQAAALVCMGCCKGEKLCLT